MACVALASLKGTIDLEFLKPNCRVSVDDEKPLKSVFKKLSSLQHFVQKKCNNGGAPIIRDLEIKIRDFALKAEDDIEIQLRNILLRPTHKEHQHKLHQTLQEVAKDAGELLNIIISGASNNGVEIRGSKPDSNIECSLELEDIIVGSQIIYNFIRHELLKDCNLQRRKISMFGQPGLGKTTFCKKLYTDEEVVSYFSIQAWVTIPREYNVQQLLCQLLQSMRPTLNEVDMGSTVVQLKEQLYNHLKCKTYLIVLDDVCDTLVWDDIQQCFPDDSNGSCILETTHFCDVAEYGSSTCYVLPFLKRNSSWDLFCHKLSLKQHMAPEFEEIGKRLIEECQGLPLSIVTVADRLSKCNYTLKEWKNVEKEVQSFGPLYRNAQHSSKLIETYNRLPQHLKVCFLYFSVIPKGRGIPIERLISLWIAEGFVKSLRGVPLEDNIAYEYLLSLVKRRLVRIHRVGNLAQSICMIHNDMHSFCVREAQKEGLLCAVNTQQCSRWSLDVLANSCHWLSLRSHSLDYYVLFSSNIPRSLLFFHGDSEMFIPFKYLRVLHLSGILILKRVPLPLGDLVFLRYLSVPQWFESLDGVVSNNLNLQTLIVCGKNRSTLGAPTLHLPSKIWEPQHLRHLELQKTYIADPPNMVKEHLRTLAWTRPTHFREQVYYKFPNLKKLKVCYKDVLEPRSSPGVGSRGNPIIILESIERLLHLETLVVVVPVGSITILERLVFPPNLKELNLSRTNLPIKVLREIGQLTNLEVLILDGAFYGRVWEVAEGGFNALQILLLEARHLERWVAKASHFPKLSTLLLKRCYFLEEIPRGFAEDSKLRVIKLEQCSPSVVSSAMWIQEERMRNKLVVPCVSVDGGILSEPNMEESEEKHQVRLTLPLEKGFDVFWTKCFGE